MTVMFQGNMLVYENHVGAPKGAKERRIFLFEQSIIIADCIKPKNEYGNPNYIYKSHFLVGYLIIHSNSRYAQKRYPTAIFSHFFGKKHNFSPFSGEQNGDGADGGG